MALNAPLFPVLFRGHPAATAHFLSGRVTPPKGDFSFLGSFFFGLGPGRLGLFRSDCSVFVLPFENLASPGPFASFLAEGFFKVRGLLFFPNFFFAAAILF